MKKSEKVISLTKLIKKVESYDSKANFDLIKKAHKFADKKHKGVNRASGEPYIIHPIGTAFILANLHMDSVSIAAGLLHDILEDTEVTLNDLKDLFGSEVANLVDGVTKISRIKYHNRDERDAESIRKMFLATVNDIRVLIIKLADKLHNMRTLKYLTEERQLRISQATLDIYAPLASRLGMATIKWELEDVAFKYLHPDMYEKFKEKFGKKRGSRENEVKKIGKTIEKELKEKTIPAKITGRPKHFYSIYRKMYVKRRSFEELHDLMAVRIITDTVEHCYEILGIMHLLWKPVPGEFDDYIAMPKANMYQSLHTTVIGPAGDPIEIQIRTDDMHKTAEEGIAAHWKYKKLAGDKNFDKKLSWLRQLLDWQRESKSTKDFMEALKIDFFEDEIYVFSPKGRVVRLPKKSTPIDFAYSIHTSVGENCVGAIVNGRIVPLRHNLKNGDMVKIITAKDSKPKRDWLKIVRSGRAKSKIRSFLKKMKIVPINSPKKESFVDESVKESLVIVENIKSPKIRLAKCCRPLPQDEIKGYLTPPNKVTIHKKGCKNVKIYKKRSNIKAYWKKDFNNVVMIKTVCHDRVGLLADVLNTIAATGTNITNASGNLKGEDLVEITVGIIPEDLEHLKDIINRIKRIQNVKKLHLES